MSEFTATFLPLIIFAIAVLGFMELFGWMLNANKKYREGTKIGEKNK